MPTDETERVVLVDDNDVAIGSAGKLEAHRGGGALHRAFSVFVHDGSGRVMLQKRASGKYHFGGLWTNTCCGHPRPGEDTEAGAQRRLREEMGIDVALTDVGVFRYEARDDASGLTEREIDHVHLGVFTGEPEPNPAEAEGWRWATPGEIDEELAADPGAFTPWFAPAWDVAKRAFKV